MRIQKLSVSLLFRVFAVFFYSLSLSLLCGRGHDVTAATQTPQPGQLDRSLSPQEEAPSRVRVLRPHGAQRVGETSARVRHRVGTQFHRYRAE